MPVDHVNTALRDLSIRRAAQLERFKRSLVSQLEEIIGAADERAIRRVRTILRRGQGARELRVLFAELKSILGEGYTNVITVLERELVQLAIDEARWQAQVLDRTVPLNIRVGQPSPSQLEQLVFRSGVNGLTVGEALEGVGLNHLNYYKSTVRTALLEGLGLPKLVAQLTQPTGPLGRARPGLERNARTAATTVSSLARQQTFRKNTKLIKGVVWISTLDDRTSITCASLDGNIYPVDSGPRPPVHPNCRSTVAPVTKAAEEVARRVGPAVRSSMNGEVAGGVTFEQWLRTQPTSIQEEVLGTTRARLFREGMPMERFTANDLSPLSLEELRRSEPEFFRRAGL